MQAIGDAHDFYAGSIDGQSIPDSVETDEASGMPETAQESFTQDDVIIVLMGQTGTGKSAFANRVIGVGDNGVGHSLESCTNAIRVLRYSSPTSSDFVLIDTPGFNDTNLSDIQILEIITAWLINTYKKSVTLSGVIYFHRIGEVRLSGTEKQSIAIFEALVGKGALQNVIVVSTMWDEIRADIAMEKERMLKEIAWKSMISQGTRTARHDNSRKSALDIVSMLAGARNHPALLIQIEMVTNGTPLPDTTVGRKVASVWAYLRKVADDVLSGLEKKKAAEGWSEELGRNIEEQNKLKIDVTNLQQRWSKMSPLRQMLGLGSVYQPRLAHNWPVIMSCTQLPQATLDTKTTCSYAPSMSLEPSTTSSDLAPMTPIYSVAAEEIPVYAATCLRYAESFKAAVYFSNLDELIKLSIFVVAHIKDSWPDERSFAFSTIHLAWFVLAVINNVGERDEQLSSGNSGPDVDNEDSDGVMVDSWKMKIESLIEALVDDLTPMRRIMHDIKTLSARHRLKRKRQAMETLACNARISIICGDLASWVKTDDLLLPIFKSDATVLLLHQRITETLLIAKQNNKSQMSPDPDATLRVILGQQQILRTVQRDVSLMRRMMDKISPTQSPPGKSNIMINGMNCKTETRNEYNLHFGGPPRRQSSGFSRLNPQRKPSVRSVESISSASTCSTVTSTSYPPSGGCV